MVKTSMLFGAILVLAMPATAAPPDFEYVKGETRAATRDAVLDQYFPSFELSDWYVIGPFDHTGRDKFDVVYAPEQGVDLEAVHEGKAGRRVRWEAVADAEWSRQDLNRYDEPDGNSDSIAYLYREVVVESAVRVDFEMGSDDGLKFWFNGRLLVNADVYRGVNVEDHRISLDLRAGRNVMLAKVSQGTGGWDFHMRPRFDSRIVAQLNYFLERDFPSSRESTHYRLLSVLEPESVVLEVGGIAIMPDGRPVVTTRRGEAWVIDGAYDDPPFDATFTRFAFGLHEPLGAVWHDGGLLVVQRGELSKLIDDDGDDRADRFLTVTDDWGVSGNYHEFAFGPKFDGEGRLWVTLNVGFCGSLGKSIVPWRGWAVRVGDDGSVIPVCGGLRSPNGLGRNAVGDMFYTDNQGDWIGTNKLSHLDTGDWHGHPAGNRWYEVAGMETPSGEADFKPPAVWFPYDRMGRSASDIALDRTEGAFGPFRDQLFVGDQYSAEVMRVDLERVNGVYQGACFPFRRGFDCGVNRLTFAPDGSLFVGMTNRGWWSHGTRPWGVQRVVFTGDTPFEVETMRVRPDGFELRFTRPVDGTAAANASSYGMVRFTHHRWEKYGSPEIEREDLQVLFARVSDDRRTVELVVDGLREGFVHELHLEGIRDEDGESLLHDMAFYTLNELP